VEGTSLAGVGGTGENGAEEGCSEEEGEGA